MFFSPIAGIIPKEATAPSLILVGFLMIDIINDIPWNRYEAAIPAFLTLLLMPFTYSITNGIGAGFISFTFLKLVTGKHQELHGLMITSAIMFFVYFSLSI